MQDKVRIGATEDRFTGAIESQTSKIPRSGYLAAVWCHHSFSHSKDRGQG